jgi:putative thioredoxin
MSDAILPGGGDGAGTDGPAGEADGLIKETSTRTFVADVVEESRRQPVVVDFWAPWCGPCKQLTPVLEKVVRAAAGAVKLVKLNIDENPGIAGQMGIQSIPAVFAFSNGQPVDGFLGAVPESQVKAFIDRLGGKPGGGAAEAALAAARVAFEAGDLTAAARGFADILQSDSQNADAIGGLAHCYLKMGDLEHARTTLALAGPELANAAPITSARAALGLAEQAAEAGDVASLQAAVEADPKNHRARFDLAIALNAAGDREGAVEALLEIVRRERGWNDEAARRQLLQFFDAWGPADEVTQSGRRRLASLLFA